MRGLTVPLLAALLLPAVARATQATPAAEPWSIFVAVGASYITDPSFDYVAPTDAMAAAEVRLSYAPGWWRNHVVLDLGYVGGALGGNTFGVETGLQVHSIQLGGRYQLPVAQAFHFYGRIAGLVDFNGLSLQSSDQPLTLSQWAVTGGLLFGVGAEATLIRYSKASIGAMIEVGYSLQFDKAVFNAVAPDVGTTRPSTIAMTPINAGALNPSGIQWRAGLNFHF